LLFCDIASVSEGERAAKRSETGFIRLVYLVGHTGQKYEIGTDFRPIE